MISRADERGPMPGRGSTWGSGPATGSGLEAECGSGRVPDAWRAPALWSGSTWGSGPATKRGLETECGSGPAVYPERSRAHGALRGSALVVLTVIAGTIGGALAPTPVAAEPLMVEGAVLELPGEEGLVTPRRVLGTWEVYVGEKLDPTMLDERDAPRYGRVPPRDGRYYLPDGQRLVTGAITYRLEIRNIPDGVPLALEIPLVYGTLEAWVNGEPVMDLLDQTRVEARTLIPLVPVHNGSVELVLCVGTHYYPYGGLAFAPPRLGRLHDLERVRAVWAFCDGLLLGIVLLVAAYHGLLGFSPNRDTPNFHLAFLSLFAGYRFFSGEGTMILGTLVNLPAEMMLRIQGPGVYVLLPVLIVYLKRMFPIETSWTAFRVIKWISWFWVVASLVVPLQWWMDLFFAYILVLVGAAAAISVTLVRAVRSSRQGARMVSVGFLVLLVSILAEGVHTLIVDMGVTSLPMWGLTLFLLANSLAVSRRMVDFRIALTNLSEQAQRDGLTGLFNRRTFDQRLREEWMRHVRSAQSLAVIMADVDHFKRYNDSNGHQAGDKILKMIAAVLEQHAQRTGDLAARYGGEEFVLILPNTSASGAYQVAGAICTAVRTRGIPHRDSPRGVVTISVGVAAVIPEHDLHGPTDPECLVAAADKALYEAKECGRDTVRTAMTEAV